MDLLYYSVPNSDRENLIVELRETTTTTSELSSGFRFHVAYKFLTTRKKFYITTNVCSTVKPLNSKY